MARVEQALDRAAVLNATNAQVHQQLGELKLQLGHADQAVTPLERAVVLQPGSSQVRLSLARAYWTANKKEDAQRQARNALTLAATDAERARAQQLLTQYSR
jgi:predicted Zn-dependent protease